MEPKLQGKSNGSGSKLIVAVQMLSIGIILLILGPVTFRMQFRRQLSCPILQNFSYQHGQHHRRRPGLRHQRRDPLPAGQEDMNILRFAPRFSDAAGSGASKFCAKSLRVPAAAESAYLPFILFKYSISIRVCRETKNGARPFSGRSGPGDTDEHPHRHGLLDRREHNRLTASLIPVSSSVEGDDLGTLRSGPRKSRPHRSFRHSLTESKIPGGKGCCATTSCVWPEAFATGTGEMVIHPETGRCPLPLLAHLLPERPNAAWAFSMGRRRGRAGRSPLL